MIHIFKGVGVHPYLIVKLLFETVVAQQTRTHDQTFEGVVDPNRPPVHPRPYLVHFWPNYAKSPQNAQMAEL